MWYFKNKRTTVAQNPNAGETAWQRTQRLLSGNATYFDYPLLPKLLNLDTGKPITQNSTYLDRNRAAQMQNNQQINQTDYEYFSKFPHFDPSDPDSFMIGFSGPDPKDTKTVRQIKIERQISDEILYGYKNSDPQIKMAEGIYKQLLRQSGSPFMAVQQTLNASLNNFDNTFSVRDINIGLNMIKNHLMKLATEDATKINKNMQQEDILRDELYRQGLEVIKDLKKKSMTNEEIESQMSNKLNNLFNQGQISERLNNELYNYFVMKINSQN